MKRFASGVVVAGLLVLAAVAACSEPYTPIMVQAGQFDPKCAEPAAVQQARISAGSTAIAADARSYYVVQFTGPVRAAWKRQATALGAALLDYVPRYAFATRMTAAQASRVASLSFVRWVAPFPAQWKYRKPLVANKQRALTLTVRLFPGARPNSVVKFITDRKLWFLGMTWNSRAAVRIRMPAGLIPNLAALPDVSWVEEYRMPKLLNDQGQRYLSVSNVTGLPWGIDAWNDYDLFGTGQIVGVMDTGLDTGNLANLHPDFLDASGKPRVAAAFAHGRTNDWSDSSDPVFPEGGHGTHVSGSVLGNGAMSGSVPGVQYYTGSFAGMAPEAKLVIQSVMDEAGYLSGIPFNFSGLFDEAYRAGARIHTNSWGSAYDFGFYTYDSMIVDDFMFRHPDMTILYSAGNEGIDLDANGVIDATSVGQPATAKNCITVGATESNRPPFSGWGGYADFTWGEGWPYYFPADPIYSDYISDNPDGMAAFSSRGPCTDGRIKPDVAAPGTNIISCRSRGKNGDYSGVNDGWGIYNEWYMYSGGTSMATPLTAGAAALVREYYERDRGFSDPSGALVKATMIHGARDLSPGQYGTGLQQEIKPRPDQSQGWGRPAIGPTLYPEVANPGTQLWFHDYGMISDTTNVDVLPLAVTTATGPISATLVWTDAAAAPYVSTALVNDLDLVVVDPNGVKYRGNFGTAAMNDRVNNVETVQIASPVTGTYYVQVSGFNVPMGPQSYSLVAYAPAATTFSISGRIADDTGFPVGGVAVTLEGIDTVPGRRVSGGTRPDGTYEIRNLTPGRYRVTPSLQSYTFTPVEQRVDLVEADVTGVDFVATVPSKLQISGYLFFQDDLNRPAAGVQVDVYRVATLDPPQSVEDVLAVYSAMTGTNGRYTVSDLKPGFYYIVVNMSALPDYFVAPDYQLIELPNAESNAQNFSLALWYGYIDVYTLDPHKIAVPSATITVERSADFDTWTTVQQTQTNSQGFVRLGGTMPSGEKVLRIGYFYRITASKRNYKFEVSPLDDHVEGFLPPIIWLFSENRYDDLATIGAFYFWGASPAPTYAATGLIRTQWDRPVPDVQITMQGLLKGRTFTARTRSNGFYYITGMPSDLYEITATKPGWELTPVDPLTAIPNPDYEPLVKVGPPAHAMGIEVLGIDPWFLGFLDRDFSYQYPDGRQDYWAMPQ